MNTTKRTLYAALISILGIALQAQTPTPVPVPVPVPVTTATPLNIYAAGVSYNPGGSPSVAGTALYAHAANTSGTFAFTVFDALPVSVKPFVVDTAVSAGIAQRVFTLGTIGLYVPTSAGISWSGGHTGWEWTTGGLVSIPIKGNWVFMPNVRVLKSSVSNNSGYQLVGGLMVGWGK